MTIKKLLKIDNNTSVKAWPDKRLSEIYSTGMQFAFVGESTNLNGEKTLAQCHPYVLCKDFLTDVIWGVLHNKTATIFGFSFDKKNNPIPSLNPIKMMVRDKTRKNAALNKCAQQCAKFMHQVEKKLGFNLCTVEKCVDDQGFARWMFILDKRWVHAPPMISMLTLYLRIGMHYNDGDTMHKAVKTFKTAGAGGKNDAGYLKNSRKMRLLILEKGISIFCDDPKDNYPKDMNVNTLHGSSGIVNCINNAIFKKIWDLSGLDEIGKVKRKQPVAFSIKIEPGESITVAVKDEDGNVHKSEKITKADDQFPFIMRNLRGLIKRSDIVLPTITVKANEVEAE
jgi:hypothetical protein